MATQNKESDGKNHESDIFYVLKLLLFIAIGGVWLRLSFLGRGYPEIPIPAGLLVGLLFAAHEKFQIDRKIEYFALIGAAMISFFLPFGLVISL